MLLPLRGVGVVWVPFTQGVALGYELLPLRGVLFMSFDTPPFFNPLFYTKPSCQCPTYSANISSRALRL